MSREQKIALYEQEFDTQIRRLRNSPSLYRYAVGLPLAAILIWSGWHYYDHPTAKMTVRSNESAQSSSGNNEQLKTHSSLPSIYTMNLGGNQDNNASDSYNVMNHIQGPSKIAKIIAYNSEENPQGLVGLNKAPVSLSFGGQKPQPVVSGSKVPFQVEGKANNTINEAPPSVATVPSNPNKAGLLIIKSASNKKSQSVAVKETNPPAAKIAESNAIDSGNKKQESARPNLSKSLASNVNTHKANNLTLSSIPPAQMANKESPNSSASPATQAVIPPNAGEEHNSMLIVGPKIAKKSYGWPYSQGYNNQVIIRSPQGKYYVVHAGSYVGHHEVLHIGQHYITLTGNVFIKR